LLAINRAVAGLRHPTLVTLPRELLSPTLLGSLANVGFALDLSL
jgi:hypothetical protein